MLCLQVDVNIVRHRLVGYIRRESSVPELFRGGVFMAIWPLTRTREAGRGGSDVSTHHDVGKYEKENKMQKDR